MIVTNNEMLEQISGNVQNLSHLETIKTVLLGVRTELLDAATGRDQIPTKSVNFMLQIFGIVIVGLLSVIGTLLIGGHFHWIELASK